MSVHRSLILTTILLVTINLSGCASFGLTGLFGKKEKPIEVKTVAVEKTPLDIQQPDPIKTKPIEWIVVTSDNAEAVFKDMEAKGQNPVLFAINDDGYQQLAITIADLRNLINTQRTIIIKYKDYYEPQKPAEKK